MTTPWERAEAKPVEEACEEAGEMGGGELRPCCCGGLMVRTRASSELSECRAWEALDMAGLEVA